MLTAKLLTCTLILTGFQTNAAFHFLGSELFLHHNRFDLKESGKIDLLPSKHIVARSTFARSNRSPKPEITETDEIEIVDKAACPTPRRNKNSEYSKIVELLRKSIMKHRQYQHCKKATAKRSISGVKTYEKNTKLKVRCKKTSNCELPNYIGLQLPAIKSKLKVQRNLFNKL